MLEVDHMNMNESDHSHDPRLEALFAREHTHLSAEPFLTAMLARVAAERRRAAVQRRVLQAAGLIALIFASPRLIAGSAWLSTQLDEVFALTAAWLATPGGMAAGVVVAVAVVALKRARVW
jgi:hypothetical protein